MSHSRTNMAVTEDGAAYNKLRRPDDYLQSLTAAPPPHAKRKFETVGTGSEQDVDEPNNKRSREAIDLSRKPHARTGASERLGEDDTASGASANPREPVTGGRHRVRPAKENGMQTMFPGLDDDSASDADDTTRDALAYLRSVRSEASTIPTLLVAPPQAPRPDQRDRSMYNNGVGDHRAVYQDGMWVAVDHDAAEGYYEEDWYEDEEDMYPQDAYYQSLLARYQALRNSLASADPRELAALVKADPKKYANVRLPYYKSDWRYAFDNKFPTPALVAQIDDKTLYRAMEYLAEVLTIGDTISKQKSTWIWTLLALVGERGTLDFYREGRIRELGHKAGQLSIRLRNSERQRHQDYEEEEGAEEWEVEGEGTDGQDDEEESEEGQECDTQAGVSAQSSSRQPDTNDVEDGELEDNSPPANLSAQLDGTYSKPTDPTIPPGKTNEDSHTSPSADEGEIQSDDEPASLEAARARLLAQLGDNLVADCIPTPDQKKQLAPAQESGGKRHRHNGKVCRDSECRVKYKGRLEARRKAGLSAGKGGYHGAVAKRESSVDRSQPTINGHERGTRQEKPGISTGETSALSTHDTSCSSASHATRDVSQPTTSSAQHQHQQDSPTGPPQHDHQTEPSHDEAGEKEKEKEKEEANVRVNTRVTIDMILTVVGECYGQRDLLGYREVW